MNDFMNDISLRDVVTASFPTGEEFLDFYKPIFRNNNISRGVGGIMLNVGRPKIQNLIGDITVLNQKGYNLAQNGLNILNTELKFKGISTKVSFCDAICLASDLAGIWSSSDTDLNQKLNETSKSLYKAAGSVIGGNIGKTVGACIGNAICPVIGGFIGGFVGTLVGGYVGSACGGLIYDGVSSLLNKGIEFFSGIFGQFRSGGVEFSYPKEIEGFKKNFGFDKYHLIAFEYEDEKNNYNASEEIIKLINSNFLIGNIKVKNLDEIYDTILKEISFGFLYKKKLPSISLNFNKGGLLYSIMDDYYKNTITGNILTFLDYYLKSYVNGGFFKEDFVFNWQNERNENRDYLQQNLIDFKKYLFDLTHNPNDINYCSMYDLTHKSENKDDYISAFRIIGFLENNLKFYKNVMFPDCSYFTQYDFDILPNWETEIDLNIEAKMDAESVKKNHKIMALRVTYLMKKLPFLKPYFELLKMITFAIHYLPNIQKIGLFPLFNNALQNKFIGEKYCKSIPKVFPPLPIRKTENIKMSFTISELFDIFKDNNYEELNKFISICFYETEPNQLDNAMNKQKNLLDKLKKYIKDKVLNNLSEQDKYIMNFFSDEKLRIPQIEKNFIDYLLSFPNCYILEKYYIIYYLLDKQENKLYKPKNPKDYITKIKSFNELKKEVEEILNIFYIYLSEFFEKEESEIKKRVNQLNKEGNEKIKDGIIKSNEEIKKIIKEKSNGNEQVFNQMMNKKEVLDIIKNAEQNIKNDIEKQKKEIIEKANKNFQEKKKKFSDIIDQLNSSLTELQNKLIFYEIINKESLNKNKEMIEGKLLFDLFYTKATFEAKDEKEKYFPIRGGCLPKINNNIYLTENQEINVQIYNSLINNYDPKPLNKNKKKYFLVKTELRSGFIFGKSLYHLTKPIDSNKIILQIALLFNNKNYSPNLKNIKDMSGNSIAFHKVILNRSIGCDIPKNEELNKSNNFGEKPELYAIATEDLDYLKRLISQPQTDFSCSNEGGLTPLALSLINDSRKMTRILLDNQYINKNGNLNFSNELGLTLLHLAVISNDDFAILKLLENGANISISNRKEANTPIHLMGIYARNEIIFNIYKNKNFIENINNQRPDGKNALHFMSGNSILGTKLFLKSGAERQTFDKFGNTQARYAFYNGRFDCYDLLLNKNGNKFDLSLKENIIKLFSNENRKEKGCPKNINYQNLKKIIEENDIKNLESFFDKMKKENIKFNDKDIYSLIELSCKIRNIEILKLLNEFTSLKKFHIGPYIGKYGLISWIKEISNFGVDIFSKSKEILNGKNIFDFCLLNDDKKLLKYLFKFINKPYDNFELEISELFCKAIIEEKINIIKQIEKELNNSKFNHIKILLEPFYKNKNLTLNKLNLIIDNFSKIDIKSINIKEVMKYSRPNILEYLLKINNVNEDKRLLEELKYLGIENDRFDNLYILLRKYPKLSNDLLDINQTTQKLNEIGKLLEEKNDNIFGLQNILEKKFIKMLNEINIGLIKIPGKNQYLPHLIIQSGNLWAFKSLKNIYKNDLFFVDDESKTCFDYLIPNIKIDAINFENLDIIIQYFGNDFENILNVIEIFTNNLRNLNFQCEDEYIRYLFSSLDDKIFISYNKNYNSIFHIIGNLNLNSEIYKMILEKLKNLKNSYPNEFKDILNLQNINGNTFLMKFLEDENYDISLEIINTFFDEIQFNLHNYFGNSILHILFLNKNFNKQTNNFVSFEKIYQLLLQILKKGKNLIISKNREENTPYILAANSGCNLAISMMLKFYSLQYLEKITEFSTALHQACINENINTIRFLIERFHYNPNEKLKKRGKKCLNKLPEGSTPLHAAALASSIEVFEYLLLHGGDPFIEDINNNDAFDISYQNGNHTFLKYIFELKSSRMFSYNDKYFLSLIKNKQKGAIDIFYKYIDENNFENYNIVNKTMDTLLIVACRAENDEIISTLINNGIDPLIKNKYGNNCLHICAYRNSFSCAGIVLSKLESNEEKNRIEEILNCKNDDGDTPLHIGCEYNFENLILLFVSFLMRSDIKIQLIKNNAGLTPLQLSIKKHNYKIALIFLKYLDLNISDILDLRNLNINKEFDDFTFAFDSGLLREHENEINEKFNNIKYYIKEKESYPFENKKDLLTQVKFIRDGNINIHDESPKYKSYEFLCYNINKYYKTDLLNAELFFNNKKIFGNIYVIAKLIKLAKEGKGYIIDFFLQILMQLQINNKKFLIENNNDNDNDLFNFIEVFIIMGFPYINEENLSQSIEFIQDLIFIFQTNNISVNNEFLKFMKNCTISYFDSKFNKPKINEFLDELDKLKNLILNNEKYLNNFKYTSSSFHTYQFLSKINLILNSIKDDYLKLLQIQYLNNIPCIFDEEIKDYLDKYHIIHEFEIYDNQIYDFVKLVLIKSNKDIYFIKEAIELTHNLIDSYELHEKEKELLIQNTTLLYNTFIKNKKIDKENISSLMKNYFLLSKKIIRNGGIELYKSVFEEIKTEVSTIEELVQYLYLYSSPKEINFPDIEEKLHHILDKIQLNEEDKINLSEIASLIPKYCEKYKYIKEFEKLGKEFGIKFKTNPNLDNLSKLIAIIVLGVSSFLNLSPYLIQCLSVASFMLHYIELKENLTNYKGKLAQIKTGEGKSLIIAMLSLANALMGNFVDVITSTHYLAERDQKKFKNFFMGFGISSSNIVKNNPSKSDYNGIIIYGTNTDFEFSLLREGIYKQKKLYTVPFDSMDNNLIERSYDVAIVDECDNLFLDTAKNSARIAHHSKSSYNWLYPIIYKYFCENEYNTNIDDLKNIIIEYENGKYKQELEKIDDNRLKELLKSAKIAKEKKLNLDYVIGYDEELSKKQIQIVSLDTGRIQYGSRWTNGIHEFIEVKEGIEPETESNVIGSISHPTYFEGYKILFGLTGTIGDEIERKEIEEIYKVKCFDIPRNFKEILVNEKMEIYTNKTEKYKRILDIIEQNKNKKDKSQPMLIILENIDETIEFGKLLKNKKYEFFILNDIQKENEDYILNNSGHNKSILVATNAAGRGTDIIIDDNSKNNGGLYVIIGFFPQNSRIEYQAIGRAGRQGNPGNAKIIISKDEEFTLYNFMLVNQFKEIENDIGKALYLTRKLIVEDISKTRISFCKKERIYFYTLKKFFLFKEFMILLYENNLFKFYYQIISRGIEFYQNFEYYKNFALMKIDDIWSEFYSDFVKERGNKNLICNKNQNNFAIFLNKFEKEWINCMKEIYQNDNKKFQADVTNICLKKLIKKLDYVINVDELSEDFNNFKKIMENIKLSDLFD